MGEINLQASGLAEDILGQGNGGREGELHLVTFNLGEEYGVLINQVQEIIRVGNMTVVPNSPAYMEGVINLRGKILPVLNLRKKLRISDEGITKSSRIVVTEVNGKVLGLLVDSVSHVMKVKGEFVEEAPDEVLEVDTDYITGVCKLPNRLVILLDLEKLLRKEKPAVMEEEEA
ncbi:MAG: chemotaxis protein CheW [Thermodesulfovibrionales bacterium]|nr:chemotaxis protein CheW [Thermodesulfovibrionales bacterium]